MAENAREYLLDFAQDKNCDPWIKNVIFIFLDSEGNVSEGDKELMVTELLDEKIDEIPFADKKQKKIVGQRIDFVSLQHIIGVNALAADQTIRFGKDINIIYGLNGTGKSSYFRIINDIIGVAKKKAILGNIYLEDQKRPQAKLKYRLNGNNAEYSWSDTSGADEALSTVRVFDTSYTMGLLKKRSSDELLVKPFRLSMFADLIALVEELLQLAHEKIMAEEQALPVIYTDNLRKEIAAIFSSETIEEDDVKKIQELLVFDETAKNRIKTIKGEMTQLQQINIGDKIRLESEHKTKVSNLKQQVQRIHFALKSYINQAKKEIEELNKRKANSDAAKRRFVNLSDIPGIDTESWKNFVSAGKEYTEETGVKVCPYCHRPYDESALALVTSYSEFLADENEVNYKKQLSVVAQLQRQIERLSLMSKSDYIVDYIPADIEREINEFVENAEAVKKAILKYIEDATCIEITVSAIDILVQKLEKYISDADETLNSLNSDADEKKKKIDALQEELDALLEKQSLTEQADSISKLIAEKNNIKRKKTIVSEISTKKLSNLSRKAHDKLLTKNLEKLFGEILTELGIKDVSIQLKSQNNKGVQQTELTIKGIKAVANILSEGEQKATALALFLTEIIMSDNHSTLVFDDPVNSLDHRMMGSFAEKLLQMDNQIVVFTHNRMFLESFSESKNGHFCKTYDTACNKNKGRHILLYETLSEGKNSKGVISKKQIEKAQTYLDEVTEMLKESPFTRKQEACAKLRFAVELLIDEVLFNNQVPTKYSTKSSRINWDGLKSISNDETIIDTLKDVHGRCSGGELHNGLERTENPVEKADIQDMVDKLKAIKAS